MEQLDHLMVGLTRSEIFCPQLRQRSLRARYDLTRISTQLVISRYREVAHDFILPLDLISILKRVMLKLKAIVRLLMF